MVEMSVGDNDQLNISDADGKSGNLLQELVLFVGGPGIDKNHALPLQEVAAVKAQRNWKNADAHTGSQFLSTLVDRPKLLRSFIGS